MSKIEQQDRGADLYPADNKGRETVRSRFTKVMRGEKPQDRLPVIEWAWWWDKTVARWQDEGLPKDFDCCQIKSYWGLDMSRHFWLPQMKAGTVAKPESKNWIADEADYNALRPELYPERIPYDKAEWKLRALEQEKGEIIVWLIFTGFFWWPRILFGIEPHLYAFYDYPELMHRINQDQVEYLLRALDDFCSVCVPDFMTFAEDMAYNHGPMISEDIFNEFLAPYYRQIIPGLKQRGIVPLVDCDGQMEQMIPWFEAVGLEGSLPLERQAGIDVNRIRRHHPDWKMIGGFDKTVMHLGEKRMRAEFERLLPAMCSGGYIPAVDHQTPPEVSMEDYRIYVRLLKEYTARVCPG